MENIFPKQVAENQLNIASVNSPKLTFVKFQSVKLGMSYQEVTEILGFKGRKLSENTLKINLGLIPSITTAMYSWENSSSLRSIKATFQDGKLIHKSKVGIR